MKNDNAATTVSAPAITTTSPIDTSNANKLTLDYKNHPAYVLFISSLKANYTKIKYDGCLQKYLKLPSNTSITSLSDILSKDPKVIEKEIITQLIEMKRANFSFNFVSPYCCPISLFFYK